MRVQGPIFLKGLYSGMAKKVLILDLDNTIYAVASIGAQLFDPLYRLIEQSGAFSGSLEQIKEDIMRKPFQLVAAQHGFSAALTDKGVALLQELTWEGPITPFSDYAHLERLPLDKFLVTTGFTLLQQSKIRGMDIEADFREIHIVDPAQTRDTKKDVIYSIVERHGYTPGDVLVVGDDPHSEIKAAQELGLDTVLYDKSGLYTGPLPRINDFSQLKEYL